MAAYIFRRLLLVIPTLWAIITINFFIIQIAPGGPVEQAIAQIEGQSSGIMASIPWLTATPARVGSAATPKPY